MNKRKYNVNIIHRDCYYYDNSDAYIFRFKPMTKKEIKNYLKQVEQEIKPYASLPEESCLYCFEIEFTEIQNATISLTNNRQNVSQQFSSHLNIKFNHKNCAKCEKQDCLKNITTGKCQDSLARKLIGEKLFKDAYTNKK